MEGANSPLPRTLPVPAPTSVGAPVGASPALLSGVLRNLLRIGLELHALVFFIRYHATVFCPDMILGGRQIPCSYLHLASLTSKQLSPALKQPLQNRPARHK